MGQNHPFLSEKSLKMPKNESNIKKSYQAEVYKILTQKLK